MRTMKEMLEEKYKDLPVDRRNEIIERLLRGIELANIPVMPSAGPCNTLRYLRITRELSQQDLADALDMERTNINAIENGRRSIGKAMAKRFGDYFNIDYRLFL